MKVHRFLAVSAAITILTGCGGGSGSREEELEITRTLLSGGESTSALTSKKWRTVFLKVNGNYVGTGSDQPCPVEVSHKTAGESTSCDPADYIEMRSDGKSRAFQDGVLAPAFSDLWQLTGETLSTVNQGGGSTVISSYTLTDAGIVAGRQRLRMRTLSETEPDGATLRPDEVGFEYVIEELP